MKMTPSKLFALVFYDHLRFKSPWNNLVKLLNAKKMIVLKKYFDFDFIAHFSFLNHCNREPRCFYYTTMIYTK